jgi:hypothetical protein
MASSSRRQSLRVLVGGTVGGLLTLLTRRRVAGQESGTPSPSSETHEELCTSDDAEARCACLERALDERRENIAFLLTMVTSLAEAHIMGDPLDEFFAHPEDWEIVIPVDPAAECRKGCGEEYRSAVRLCQELPEGERLACVQEAEKVLRRCSRVCWEQA